jgi:hypothetical protein
VSGPALRATAVGLVALGLATTLGCQSKTNLVRTAPSVAPSVTQAPSRPGQMLPTVRPRPRYLTRSYQAPGRLVAHGEGGTLSIPSLHVTVPVDAVGLDEGAMALPNDPSRVGWLRTTAEAGDAIGSSVVSGHVSDLHDVPGALSTLKEVRPGASISWTDRQGVEHRYVVEDLHRYPRVTGVPADLFRVDGPHLLYVVTCADRQETAGGGFHYASNLVVTARAVGEG